MSRANSSTVAHRRASRSSGDPLAAQTGRRETGSEWGAIGYAADGTYAQTAAGADCSPMAHRKVTSECAAFERGPCEIVTFPGAYCAAVAAYIGLRPGQARPLFPLRHRPQPREGATACRDRVQRAAAAEREQCEDQGRSCADGPLARARPEAGSSHANDPDTQRGTFRCLRSDEPRARRTDSGSSDSADYFGAIAFTADGSWATVWKMTSRPRPKPMWPSGVPSSGAGAARWSHFPGEQCVGLATFIGRSGRTRWKLSFTGGGMSGPEAQRTAMDRCNSDSRTRGAMPAAHPGVRRRALSLTHRACSCEQQLRHAR